MLPTDYSLAQMRKLVVSLVFVGGAVAALVLTGYDPSFTEAIVVLTGAVFGAVGVFGTSNSTPDDLSKAVAQLQGAALSVVGYFTVVPASTVEHITILAGALLSGYLVWQTRNDPA